MPRLAVSWHVVGVCLSVADEWKPPLDRLVVADPASADRDLTERRPQAFAVRPFAQLVWQFEGIFVADAYLRPLPIILLDRKSIR